MTRQRLIVIGATVLVLALVVFLILSRRKGDEAAADPVPTAVVTLAPVRTGRLEDVVSVYGLVQADPTGSITLAAPRAAIVNQVLVRSGQSVAAGQTLLEISSAPGAELSFKQAADAVGFAKADLARVQRLYDERLAASDQLGAAKKTLADAEATLTAQQKQGGGQSRQAIRAPHAGIVTAVSAAAGDHVAQDAPLVVLARAGGLGGSQGFRGHLDLCA